MLKALCPYRDFKGAFLNLALFTEYADSKLLWHSVVSPMPLRMRESESGTLPRAKVWYGAKPNNRVSQQTQAKSELLAKGEIADPGPGMAWA